MGNSKTIYRFEIPDFNNIQFETIGISNMKSLAKQLNNDYKGLNFKVKGIPSITIEDYMKLSFPNGKSTSVFIPPKVDLSTTDFTNRLNTILNKRKDTK